MLVDMADEKEMLFAFDMGTSVAVTDPFRTAFAQDFIEGKYFNMPLIEVPGDN